MVMDCEHFASDLSVARFVGADEAELVTSGGWGETVEQEEDTDDEEDDVLVGLCEGGVAEEVGELLADQRGERGPWGVGG
jgi:hypothetical protein